MASDAAHLAGRFDFTRNAISQLALGEAGWIQTVNFLLTGTLLIAGAAGLRRVLRGGAGGTWGPVLVGVFGASFWAAAIFPADAGAGFPEGSPDATVISGHGAAHMLAGMVGYLALCAAFVVLTRPLAARGHRRWARASRLVPVVVLAGFVASAISVLAFTAGAGLGLLGLTAVTARLAITRANCQPPAAPGRHHRHHQDHFDGKPGTSHDRRSKGSAQVRARPGTRSRQRPCRAHTRRDQRPVTGNVITPSGGWQIM